MNKTGLKQLIKALSFMCVLLVLIVASSYMLAPKDNTAEGGIVNPNANGFFSEPKDSIDIAVVGNSDAYSGFSPLELWNEYGYTSYVSAEGHQTVAQSYSQLKKIIKCHSVKLIILETDGFFTRSKIVESTAKLINASMGSAFSVFQYHDRWKRVKPKELLKAPNYTAHCTAKGQWLSNEVKGYMGGEYMVKTDKREEIPFSTKTSLDMLVKTCAENNIKLLFLELPSQSSWSYKRHNAVKDYADEKGITFLDLNIDRESFGFDWKTDTRDGGNHLNSRGARKATLFIGKYLSENYPLSDHRGDNRFKQWNADYKEYLEKVKI